MNVEGFIERIEKHYLQDALESLKDNPKELINIYLSAKEFTRAKLMRGNAVPQDDEGDDRHIYIKIQDKPIGVSGYAGDMLMKNDSKPLGMPHED